MTCVQRMISQMSDQLLIFTINIILSFFTSHGGVNKFIGSTNPTAHIQYHRAQTNWSQARQPNSMWFQAEDIFLFEFWANSLYSIFNVYLFGLLEELR